MPKKKPSEPNEPVPTDAPKSAEQIVTELFGDIQASLARRDAHLQVVNADTAQAVDAAASALAQIGLPDDATLTEATRMLGVTF